MTGFIIADRLAFVSGGASGIGRAIAEAIVAKGGRVAIGDLDLGKANDVAASLGDAARAYPCDVRDLASLTALTDAIEADLGPVDIAFANAGISLNGPVLDTDPAAFDRIVAINVRGVWGVASVFGKRMVARGSGYLCLTGSEHSFGLPHGGSGIYTMTKHAVLGLADALRPELPAGVGLSVLCPGMVSTQLYDDARYDDQPREDPLLEFRRELLSNGVDPSQVAAKAIAGVERGDFIIPTHGHTRHVADKRYADIVAGFEVHAPDPSGAERYDASIIIARMVERMGLPGA